MSKVVAFVADINGAGMLQHDCRFRPRLRSFDYDEDEPSEREPTRHADEPLSLRTTIISWIALATLSWALLILVVVTLWRAL